MAKEVDASTGQNTRFYTVERSVGLGGGNYTDDVMLVQFYLQRIYSHPFTAFSPPEPGSIAVDGVCGPITCRWIRDFQLTKQSKDMPPSRIRADARVSPVPEPVANHLSYTIVLLNRQHGEYYPQEDVRLAPDAPPYLRNALSKFVITYGGGI